MAPAPYSLQDNWALLAMLALLWASLAWVEGTSTLDPNAMKALLNEVAKQRILQELNLSEPPNITQPLPRAAIANALRIMHMGEAWMDGMGNSSGCGDSNPDEQAYEIIHFAETEPSRLLQFQFNHTKGQDKHILQAHLWLYLKAHGRITLQIYRAGHREAALAEQRLESKASGWHSFSLMPAMQSIFEQEEKTLTLELQCVGCRDNASSLVTAANSSNLPFLVVKIQEPDHQVVKRSQSCNENSTLCCRTDYYVKFRDLRWDNWIIHPSGYQMNYCTGDCPIKMTSRSLNEVILSSFSFHKIPIGVHSCCVPKQLEAISILYFNLKLEVKKADIPNMIVETCGCS